MKPTLPVNSTPNWGLVARAWLLLKNIQTFHCFSLCTTFAQLKSEFLLKSEERVFFWTKICLLQHRKVCFFCFPNFPLFLCFFASAATFDNIYFFERQFDHVAHWSTMKMFDAIFIVLNFNNSKLFKIKSFRAKQKKVAVFRSSRGCMNHESWKELSFSCANLVHTEKQWKVWRKYNHVWILFSNNYAFAARRQ